MHRIGQRRHFRDVFSGVAAALVLTLGGGIAAFFLIRHYEGSNVQTYFETATYLLAAMILTYMTFWMQSHAKGLAKELEQRSDLALSNGKRWGLGTARLPGRGARGTRDDGLHLGDQSSPPIGKRRPRCTGSSSCSAPDSDSRSHSILAFAIFKLGAKLNMRKFFRVLGVTLMLFAAGLLADAVENMQQLHWLNFGGHVLWNTSGTISEASSFGDVLHSLLGYADQPTVLQALVWIVYSVVSTILFIRMGKGGGHRHRSAHSHALGTPNNGNLASP